MDRTLNFITQSLGLLVLGILSFMLGFNASYKYSHIHLFIDFLVKCYTWVIHWFWSGVEIASHYLQRHNILLSQYDEMVTQIFAGFIFIFALGLLLETLYRIIRNSFFSHSTKRS